MSNYPDLNIRQLYDLIFDYVTLQLSGFDKSDQLKQLKAVADNREDGLYDKALNEAMSSHIPYIPIVSDKQEIPDYIRVLSDSIAETNYGIAQVSGVEMTKRGIINGQYVLYEKNVLPKNNDIVLVKYKNQVMIKNYTKKDNTIVLSTSSKEFDDIILDKGDLYNILGIVRLSLNRI